MEEWELDAEISTSESQDFRAMVGEEIFLTKFQALTAKKILAVSNKFHVNTEVLLDGIITWINKIKSEVDTNEKIR